MDDAPFRTRHRLLFLLTLALALSLLLPRVLRDLHPPRADAPVTSGPIDLRSVDINRGDQAALESLPGIGPALAARIIEERKRGGPFRKTEDLRRVKGIGPVKSKALEPYILFGP
jgi:DNA uptake protein ComE-like DNA-binding protein